MQDSHYTGSPQRAPFDTPEFSYSGIIVPRISFKVSEEEAQRIRAHACSESLSFSEFLRRQAMALCRPPTVIKQTKCPLTAAIIFDRAKDMAPLTVDSTREMLADFPKSRCLIFRTFTTSWLGGGTLTPSIIGSCNGSP
jgi:hypothetical protein